MGRARVVFGREKFFSHRNTNKTKVGFNLVLGILFKELKGGYMGNWE